MLQIAELGINHNGKFDRAVAMIEAAKRAGADIAKFQYYDAAKLLGKDSPYYEYADACQFGKDVHEELKEICDKIGIEYLVSVFDVKDIEWADKLCKRHKIASRMNQDTGFFDVLQATGKPLIMSVSSDAVMVPPNTDTMYCITKYPTPLEEMSALPCRKDLGLSSHCPSIAPSLLAVARGSQILENHVTFDRNMSGCDQGSSITFEELAQLVKLSKDIEVIR